MYKVKVFHNFSENIVNNWLLQAIDIEVMEIKVSSGTLVILYKTN